VSTDAVAEAIWGPRTQRAASTATPHLSRLRSILGSADTDEPVLVRTGGGLALTSTPPLIISTGHVSKLSAAV
jgi:hypothetical protein